MRLECSFELSGVEVPRFSVEAVEGIGKLFTLHHVPKARRVDPPRNGVKRERPLRGFFVHLAREHPHPLDQLIPGENPLLDQQLGQRAQDRVLGHGPRCRRPLSFRGRFGGRARFGAGG